ncbi:MAG: MFS transporter [Clostridiales bacterium]|nr:MFS transporter [Clostridiales bacterium]
MPIDKIFSWLGVQKEGQRLLKATYFSFFTSGLMSIMLGTLMPYIISENGFSYAQSGLILSAHQIGNLCAVLAAGFLPYIIGRKRSALILGAGTTIGLLIASFSKGLLLFWLAFALMGIGRGTMSNICNASASGYAKNKAAAINLLHAVFATGALLSPFVVFIFTRGEPPFWKGATLTVALLTASAWFFLTRGGISTAKLEREKGHSLDFLKNMHFWLSTLILFFYLCAEASIIGWFVVYFREQGILPPLVAEFTPTILWFVIMLGRLLCAFLSQRYDKAKLLLLLSIGVTFCFAGMLLSKTATLSVIFLLGIGFFMGGVYPTTFSTVPGTSSTFTTGFVIALASFGAIIMPGLVGAVADKHGLYGGVATILVALSVMLVLSLIKVLYKESKTQ